MWRVERGGRRIQVRREREKRALQGRRGLRVNCAEKRGCHVMNIWPYKRSRSSKRICTVGTTWAASKFHSRVLIGFSRRSHCDRNLVSGPLRTDHSHGLSLLFNHQFPEAPETLQKFILGIPQRPLDLIRPTPFKLHASMI